MFLQSAVSVRKVIQLAGISHSSWYAYEKRKNHLLKEDQRKQNTGRPAPGYTLNRDGVIVPDPTLLALIRSYRQKPEFLAGGGNKKLMHYLRRDYGFYVNHKKIARICRENGLSLPCRKKTKVSTWREVSRNRIITQPNELWEFDIKYGYVHEEKRFFFVLAFLDVFTRKVVGFYIGRRCQGGDLSYTLDEALKKEEVGEEGCLVIRSDNGPQMSSRVFHEYLKKLEMKLMHEFIPPATPNKNAHVESFFSILEIEFIRTRYFRTFAKAYEQTTKFIHFYNETRVHGSLGYRTPIEVMERFKRGEEVKLKPISL